MQSIKSLPIVFIQYSTFQGPFFWIILFQILNINFRFFKSNQHSTLIYNKLTNMDAYRPYVDYITSGGVAETAYILTRQGQVCASNLGIKEMPRYEFELEDEKDPTKKHKVLVDERVNLLEALENNGVAKNKAGIRIYNQKYYTVHWDANTNTLYLKKEKGGACICVTKNLILIGTFNPGHKMQNGVPQNPGELNKRVETLAKDLIKKGY